MSDMTLSQQIKRLEENEIKFDTLVNGAEGQNVDLGGKSTPTIRSLYANLTGETFRNDVVQRACSCAKYWALQANAIATDEAVIATGSTEARTLADRFGDVVNVKDFGAVGDGEHDDTEAFKKASSIGDNVFPIVPSGNYKLSGIMDRRFVSTGGKISIVDGYAEIINPAISYDAAKTRRNLLTKLPYANDERSYYQQTYGHCYAQSFFIDYSKSAIFVQCHTDADVEVIIVFSVSGKVLGSFSLARSASGDGYGENVCYLRHDGKDLLYFIANKTTINEYDITGISYNRQLLQPIRQISIPECEVSQALCVLGYGEFMATAWGLSIGSHNDMLMLHKFSETEYKGFTQFDFVSAGAKGYKYESEEEQIVGKMQGFAKTADGFVFVCGDGVQVSEYEKTPASNITLKKFNNYGELQESVALGCDKTAQFIEDITGEVSTFSEPECVFIGPNGEIYTLEIQNAESVTGGLNIWRWFSNHAEAVDFSYCIAEQPNISIIKLSYGMYPRNIDSLYNPITGKRFETLNDILMFMKHTKMPVFRFYWNTSTNISMPSDKMLVASGDVFEIVQKNSDTYYVTTRGNNIYSAIVFCSDDGTLTFSDDIYGNILANKFLLNLRYDSSGVGRANMDLLHNTGTEYKTYTIFDVLDENSSIKKLRFGSVTSENALFTDYEFYIKSSGTVKKVFSVAPGTARPGEDNAVKNGSPSLRWEQIYAASGSINTSDANEKQDVQPYPDAVLDAWGEVELRQFLFKDAVKKKGEAARIHAGVIAQQVVEAFKKHGLDATKYGLLCYDEWPDEYEDVEVVDVPAVLDGNGNEVTPAQKHTEQRVVTEAGSRYGIRYSEAICIEAAYQRRRAQRLEESVSALIKRIDSLEKKISV